MADIYDGTKLQKQVDQQSSRRTVNGDTTTLHARPLKAILQVFDREGWIYRKLRTPLTTILALLVIFAIALRISPKPFQSRYSIVEQSNIQPYAGFQQNNGKFPLEELKRILQAEPSAEKIAAWSHYYTSTSHLPGEGETQGLWTKAKWKEFGLPQTEIVSYNVAVGIPVRQRLALLETFENEEFAPKVLYEAALMEDMPEDDQSLVRTPAYSGNSFSGNITAQFVYANFGLPEDYDALEEAKVDFTGKIAVIKNGRTFRGVKFETAVTRGIIGIIFYTDPQQDGNITEANGFRPYPDGPARPHTYIERGSIKPLDSNCTGPNFSVDGESIPSLPVSASDIVPILKALRGNGPRAAEMGDSWHDGGLNHLGVEYFVGPSSQDIVLNLDNLMNYEEKRVHNIIGTIDGLSRDDVVILGNHRDAWTAGAGDPGSGSAALMEVVRSFAEAYKKGWKPQRTLIFASWEGEELGQVGSGPWISENLAWLSKSAVAYLNVVVAGSGQTFHAKASPLLRRVIHDATKAVISPSSTKSERTVFDHWGGEIFPAGGGDAIPFLQDACVSTADIGFSPGPQDPIFPYHSNFDTFTWMDTVGDRNWEHHSTTTKIWSLIAAQLTEAPIVNFEVTDYAIMLNQSVAAFQDKMSNSIQCDIEPLKQSIAAFYESSNDFDSSVSTIRDQILQGNISNSIGNRVHQANEICKSVERQFCHRYFRAGKQRSEHVIFERSPWYWNPEPFPRLVKSIESADCKEANKWRDIIRDKIDKATSLLNTVRTE